MKRLMTVLLMMTTTSLLAAEPATKDTGTRYAARMLRIKNVASGQEEATTRELLLDVASDLAPKFAGVEAKQLTNWITIQPVIAGDLTLSMEITLRPENGAKPAAGALADAIVEEMNRRITANFEQLSDREVARATEEVEDAKRRAAEMQERAQALRLKVRQLAGRADVSSAGVTNAVTRLEEEKQRLELDLRGKNAKREALAQQIAEAAKAIETKVAGDAIAAELKKVVEARELTLKNVEQVFANGQASQSDVSESVAKLAEARSKLLQQQRDAALAAGGQALIDMNKELMSLSVDVRALQAQLDFINDRLPGLAAAAEQLDGLQQVESQLTRANSAMEQTNESLRSLQRTLRQTPRALIVVISAKDGPEVEDLTSGSGGPSH